MIRFLYDNKLTQFFVFTFSVIGLRAAAFLFLSTDDVIPQKGILQAPLLQLGEFPWLSFSLSTLVFLLQGFLFLRLCDNYNVIERPGLSIFFFIGLFSVLFPSTLSLNFIHIGTLFVLLSWLSFYRFIKEGYNKTFLFLSAFFLGITSLFIPDFYWSLVFLLLIIPFFKPISAADVLVIVFAVLMPYYLIASFGYLFSTDINFKSLLSVWREPTSSLQFLWTEHIWEYSLIGNLLLIGFFGVFKVGSTYYRYNVETRRSRLAMLLISLFIFLIVLVQFDEYSTYFHLLSFPLGLYTATVFNLNRPSNAIKMLFWLYILLLIVFPYKGLLLSI